MNRSFSRRSFISTLSVSLLFSKLMGKRTTAEKKKRKLKNPPNILWISVEDISPFLSCYGHANPTPNIDKLAENGAQFNRTFMPAPVCSPCRSSLLTGMMPTTTGVHNHHSSRTEETAIDLPQGVKTLPELFREAGYFTFNQGKDDYNFRYKREDLYSGKYRTHKLYGKSGDRITGWNQREPGQPFFGQIQLFGGKEIYSKKFKSRVKNPFNRNKVKIPPYYPVTPEMRDEWADHLDSIQITDRHVGDIVDKLKQDKLLDNTVIIFFSDHGMRLWRHKQFCYDSSLHVPFIIGNMGRKNIIPKRGVKRDELVNGMDIAATSLALAGIEVPDYMESRDLFDGSSRKYVISARDRCDFTIDRIRTVRTDKFRYIRNFFPDRPYMQPNYRDEWQITKLVRRLHSEGKLNNIQSRFWNKERPTEELYDIENDPHELKNLALDDKYSSQLNRHRKILTKWICRTGDLGQYPEDKKNLKYMYDFWGKKCENPEYDCFKED